MFFTVCSRFASKKSKYKKKQEVRQIHTRKLAAELFGNINSLILATLEVTYGGVHEIFMPLMVIDALPLNYHYSQKLTRHTKFLAEIF